MKRRLLRWLLGPSFEFDATTHEGMYSPCDDDHCYEVRVKIRKMLRR
jgi:hypothetical protein